MKERVARIVLAVFIAPLAILPVILAFLAITRLSPENGNVSLSDLFILISMTGLLIAYPMTAIFGLPIYFLLLHFKMRSYLIFAIVGALAALILALILYEFQLELADQVFAVLISVSGASVAATFRAIAGVPVTNDNSNWHSAA